MCGISVVLSAKQLPYDSIERMVSSLSHRGPDAHGMQRLPGCHIGQSRLSIIDLVTGSQPMCDASGRFWIAFNGEIYNYRELRTLLQEAGYLFKTSSDTEVILAAYALWGEKCLDRFRGMYAFALWDQEQMRLFAARDIFGEKPLYYAITPDGSLLVASEIKAIVASGMISPKLDLMSVDAYLAHGYVPPDRTVYSNIQTLPPGHYLLWKNCELKVVRYWQPVLETQPMTLSDAGAHLRELLQQAVNRQMVADVPVGAFLSGGLDSSTIVALMQRQSDRPIKTFSVGFGSYINELPYALSVAKKYETEHHSIDLGKPDVAGMLLRMAEIYDEPFSDTSNIPTYLISEFARQHVKVVLTGDGADELFGGYSWTYPMLVKSGKVSDSLLVWIMLRSLSKLLRHRSKTLSLYSAGCGLAARRSDMWSRQVLQHVYIKSAQRKSLWGERRSYVEPYEPGEYYRPPSGTEGVNQGFYYDLTAYLPGDILVKVDRAAMAHGLETRAPFLDRDLVEFALSVPVNLKVDDWKTKVVLQEACSSFWPEELQGRSKQGFGSPVDEWLKDREVADLMQAVFAKSSRLSNLLPGIGSRSCKNVFETWILLVLGLWLDKNEVSV